MSKTRRELFEDQLRDLQKDIASLTQKLAVPSAVTINRLSTSSTGGYSTSSHTALDSKPKEEISYSQKSEQFLNIDPEQQLDYVNLHLRKALQEKDEAIRKYEQAKQEIEDLRRAITEFSKVQSSIDALRQDNEALKISLESSERIRLQQKELIAVLQKSHAILSDSSVATFNSISSISHKAEQDSSLQVKFAPNNYTTAKDWLSISSQPSVNQQQQQQQQPLYDPSKSLMNNEYLTRLQQNVANQSSMVSGTVDMTPKSSNKGKKSSSTNDQGQGAKEKEKLSRSARKAHHAQTEQGASRQHAHSTTTTTTTSKAATHSSSSAPSSSTSSYVQNMQANDTTLTPHYHLPSQMMTGTTSLMHNPYNLSTGSALGGNSFLSGASATATTTPGKPPLYPSASYVNQLAQLQSQFAGSNNAYAASLLSAQAQQARQMQGEINTTTGGAAHHSASKADGGATSKKAKRDSVSNKKASSKNKEKRSSSAPPNSRYMFRSIPTPISSFSKAERWTGF